MIPASPSSGQWQNGWNGSRLAQPTGRHVPLPAGRYTDSRRAFASAIGRGGGDMAGPAAESARIRGCCNVYYALDIGFAVDLKHCASLIHEARQGGGFGDHSRMPSYLGPRPTPVRVSQAIEPVQGSSFRSEDRVTLTIYDFGAVSVQYRVPFEDTLERIAALSSELYDNKQFAADAKGPGRIAPGGDWSGGAEAEGPRGDRGLSGVRHSHAGGRRWADRPLPGGQRANAGADLSSNTAPLSADNSSGKTCRAGSPITPTT